MKLIFKFIVLFFLLFIFVATGIGFYFFVLPPQVIGITPENNSENILLNTEVVIKFNKPIKRQKLQHFISPESYGEWRYENSLIKNHLFRALVFKPAIDFKPDTQYQIELKDITSPFGIRFSHDFTFTFRTQVISEKENVKEKNEPKKEIISEIKPVQAAEKPAPKITLLDIALDWQDYSLSCEAASLKMALAYKGIFVSEDKIMEKIGYDLTPRKDNIWGDPYKAYVGKIDGKICSTGFGVFWEPTARAASVWRPAEPFFGWTLENLLKEISAGNPIVVWGVLPVERLTDCSWRTLEGKYIKAYWQTHVRLIVGFIGDRKNPLKIILNDPLAGTLYWPTEQFLTNWKTFGYSGVVVR